MKKILALLLALATLFAVVGCATQTPEVNDSSEKAATEDPTTVGTNQPTEKPTESTTEPTTETPDDPKDPMPEPLDKSKQYRILFIGNSYTYYNDMPDLFENVAKAAGYDVVADKITKGSHTLQGFADPTDAQGTKVHTVLKSSIKYDYVVIQEQSSRPVSDPALFYDGVRNLDQMIKATGAKTVLYSTWGRKTGHSILSTMGWTNETMTWDLAAKYTAIGAELDIPVAYVGLAFYDVYAGNKGVNIYNDDKSHSSLEGSYLAALTIFSTIFGETPMGISFRSTVSAKDAEILQQAAYDAVYNTPEIPEKYKTKSEGIVAPSEDQLAINDSQRANLKSYPTSQIISLGTGKGILGTKGQVASTAFSLTGFTDAQKKDIADIGYGVSYIGVEKVNSSNGQETAFGNLVNGEWSSSKVTNITFDQNRYDINGVQNNAEGKYTALITLNFGQMCKFDAVGFFSGSLEGFPGAAEVFVSEDGVNWTRVVTACWDAVNGKELVSAGKSPADYNGTTQKVGCLFDMSQCSGQYVRVGVVTGRYDQPGYYNTINTRELVVYGSYETK